MVSRKVGFASLMTKVVFGFYTIMAVSALLFVVRCMQAGNFAFGAGLLCCVVATMGLMVYSCFFSKSSAASSCHEFSGTCSVRGIDIGEVSVTCVSTDEANSSLSLVSANKKYDAVLTSGVLVGDVVGDSVSFLARGIGSVCFHGDAASELRERLLSDGAAALPSA
jgi:hypothetical protein